MPAGGKMPQGSAGVVNVAVALTLDGGIMAGGRAGVIYVAVAISLLAIYLAVAILQYCN